MQRFFVNPNCQLKKPQPSDKFNYVDTHLEILKPDCRKIGFHSKISHLSKGKK